MSKKKSKPLKYFFWKGELHRKLHINRPADVITCWNYPQGKVVKYSYRAVRSNGQKAFTTREVEQLIRRGPRRIKQLISDGEIRKPAASYGLGDRDKKDYAYYWTEEDIMDLHAFFSSQHRGRPRKDGLVTPSNLPSAYELRAMIRQGTVFYVQDGEGNFVPTWEAEKF